MTNNFNQSVTQWDFRACFLRTMSEILGTVFERYILTSSLGTEPSPESFQQGSWHYKNWRNSTNT